MNINKIVYDSFTHGFYGVDSFGRTWFVNESNVGDSISDAFRQHGFIAKPVPQSLAHKRLYT